MAGEVHGLGAKFNRWNGTDAWVEICNITNIGGPSMSKDTLETTDLCATGGFRTFIGGLKDGGEVTLSMNYAKDVFADMLADFLADDLGNYAIVLPVSDGTVIEFTGLITAMPLEIPYDEKITFEVTIKVSGEPTFDSSLTPIVP